MSIATLKRKTKLGGNPRLDPISGVGNLGFALNGTLRNYGGVGCFRMVSNVTRTPFRGNLPMGNGGCCGTYYNAPLNSGNCCTNDSSIVKKSVKNTDGMLMEKYKGILFGTYPNTWVKDDSNSYRITKTQAQYIENLSWKYGSCNFNPALKESVEDVCKCPQGKYIYIGTKKKLFYKPTTKSVASFTPYGTNISQGLYITAGGVAKNNCLPTPDCLQHFPMMLSHNGCDRNFYTWQQARDAGLLPKNYLQCDNSCVLLQGNPPTPEVIILNASDDFPTNASSRGSVGFAIAYPSGNWPVGYSDFTQLTITNTNNSYSVVISGSTYLNALGAKYFVYAERDDSGGFYGALAAAGFANVASVTVSNPGIATGASQGSGLRFDFAGGSGCAPSTYTTSYNPPPGLLRSLHNKLGIDVTQGWIANFYYSINSSTLSGGFSGIGSFEIGWQGYNPGAGRSITSAWSSPSYSGIPPNQSFVSPALNGATYYNYPGIPKMIAPNP